MALAFFFFPELDLCWLSALDLMQSQKRTGTIVSLSKHIPEECVILFPIITVLLYFAIHQQYKTSLLSLMFSF